MRLATSAHGVGGGARASLKRCRARRSVRVGHRRCSSVECRVHARSRSPGSPPAAGTALVNASVVSTTPTSTFAWVVAPRCAEAARPAVAARRSGRGRCGAPARRRRSPSPAIRRETGPARRAWHRSGRSSSRPPRHGRCRREPSGRRPPGEQHPRRSVQSRRASKPGRRRRTGTSGGDDPLASRARRRPTRSPVAGSAP